MTISRIANISHDCFASYTGTPIPTDYKFVCWVGDDDEKERLTIESDNSRDIIQIAIPLEE